MRRHTAIGILPFVLIATLPAQAQMVTTTPEQIGQIFCIGRLGNDMAPVLALTTPVLRAAIAYAEARSATIQLAAPDEKPPLGDGVPWQSWQDYAPQCSVGEIKTSATMTGVSIDYAFPDQPDASWTDTLVLVPVVTEPGMPPFLRIDDITYATGGTLQSALTDAFAP